MRHIMKKIVVAGGCFWGVAEYYRRLKGVTHVEAGYAQGKTNNPTYEQVSYTDTNHAEVVEVTYDESKISLMKILEHLFRMIDPTSLNKQGNDVGTQYRTGVYYSDVEDLEIIETFIGLQRKQYEHEIVVEVEPLDKFWIAEQYHQDYLIKNPTGYCHIDMSLIEDHERKEDISPK